MPTRPVLLTLLALSVLVAATPALPTAAASEWPGFQLCSTAQPEWYYHCDGVACLHVWAYAWNVDERVCTPA